MKTNTNSVLAIVLLLLGISSSGRVDEGPRPQNDIDLGVNLWRRCQ